MLILDSTFGPSTRGGKNVECGIALALGKLLVTVGPRENVFSYLASRAFETWPECVAWLASLAKFKEDVA